MKIKNSSSATDKTSAAITENERETSQCLEDKKPETLYFLLN